MTDGCKHKSAAGAINWFVGLLKGKTGSDQKATMSALASMLHDMRSHNCSQCPTLIGCHDLDAAMRAISTKDDLSHLAADQGPVGPMMMRREQARKNRLVRPSGL